MEATSDPVLSDIASFMPSVGSLGESSQAGVKQGFRQLVQEPLVDQSWINSATQTAA